MQVVSGAEMRACEQRAFDAGLDAEALMEEAGQQMFRAIRQFRPIAGTVSVFFGKGHNGGDALVVARLLQEAGCEIELHPAFPEDAWSPLTRKKHAELAEKQGLPRKIDVPRIVLDGLLGIGASSPLKEPLRSAVAEINRLHAQGATVFAMDVPTGIDADGNGNGADRDEAVTADFTLTVGFPKRGLLADKATRYVGRLVSLPLAGLPEAESASTDSVATSWDLASLLPRRNYDSHKGDYGRVGIVAGSVGMTGAAVLAATGALRAGAGLVYLFAQREIYPILATMAPPEVMVRPMDRFEEVLDARLDALAIGPGLGRSEGEQIRDLIRRFPRPCVIDADALNAVSEEPTVLWHCAGPRLLTPHPGEMARLFPDAPHSRAEIAGEFVRKYPVTLLLKGARTIVAHADVPLSYNSTGKPAMATGGMGDVLTGVCAALLGQHLSTYDAARLGAWICGRAAESALIRGGHSEESLLPTDLATNLGIAFQELRRFCF